jgi:quercetin dioxygenase-like cupin family protein
MKQNINTLILVGGLVAGIGAMGGSVAQAQAPNAPTAKQLLQTDLKGVAGQEALVFVVDFAPGQILPWHVHPGGHELVYGLEGTLVIEDQNSKKLTVKTGDVSHVDPDVGHTARNEGTTLAKVLVVRVKDKAKPVAAPFQR